jgi:hypothetical protein
MGPSGADRHRRWVSVLSSLRLTLLAAAGLRVAAVFLGYRLVPYRGTIAVLAMALSSPRPAAVRRRWTHPVALARLTLPAGAADHRTGGYGWSTQIAGGDRYAIRFGRPGQCGPPGRGRLSVVSSGCSDGSTFPAR